MEDAHLAVADFDEDVGLYGVFDGHGGKAVSRFAAKHLPGLLKESPAYKLGDYKKALEEAFVEMDVRLRADAGREILKECDQLEPGQQVKPLVMPRSVVRRFMAQSGAVDKDESDDRDWEDDEEDELEQMEKASKGEVAKGEADAGKAGDEAGAEAGAEADAKAAKGGEGEGVEEALRLVSEEEGDEDDESMEHEGDSSDDEDFDPSRDDELVQINPAALMSDPTPEAQGCTAVVVLVVRSTSGEGPRLICANAGDSRAVLGRRGHAVALSEDHKPECPLEVARITKAGGYVQMDAPGGPRVQGDLNLSRAFGDLRYKTSPELPPEAQVLSAFPEVRTIPLTSEDEFMVIGCDGIWERLTNQGAVDFVRPKLKALLEAGTNGEPLALLSSLCAEICDRGLCPSMDQAENPAFDGHGCDNMTVSIVQLKSVISGEVDAVAAAAALAAELLAARQAGRSPEDEAAARQAVAEAAAAKANNNSDGPPAKIARLT